MPDQQAPAAQPSNQEQATQLLAQIPFGAVIGSPLKAAVEAQAAAAMACYNFIDQVGFDPEPPQGDVPNSDGGHSDGGHSDGGHSDGGHSDGGHSDGGQGSPAAGDPARALAPLERVAARKRVRDITFVFQRSLAPGSPPNPASATVSITVPLLTIMPLPFIRIESLTVNFKTAISALDARTQTDNSSSSKELKADGTLGFAWWKLNVGGSISSKKDSTATNTSKYSVEHTMDISMHAVQDDMPAGLARLLGM